MNHYQKAESNLGTAFHLESNVGAKSPSPWFALAMAIVHVLLDIAESLHHITAQGSGRD